MSPLPKIIVIVGPTASGKTGLGLALAKKFDGEIISADSRQIYKKMDIGTAKPAGGWQQVHGRDVFVVEDVPHYFMDSVDPREELSLVDFKKQAIETIADITNRGKLPIVVGGTGLYVWALVDNLILPSVAPHKELRKKLEQRSLSELALWLEKIDPDSHAVIDRQNPRRVIRALEVAIVTGNSFVAQQKKEAPLFSALQIGLRWPLPELYGRIDSRVDSQIAQGLVDETKGLLADGYAFSLPSMSSIGYAQIGDYLRGQTTLLQAVEQIKQATHRYAKRQLTWFRAHPEIHWIEQADEGQAIPLVVAFLGEATV